jgi:hypothetical protein
MEPQQQQAATVPPSPLAAGSTMRAIVQSAYGSADVLHLAQIAVPEISDGEVLLRVHAAGLDRGAWHLMTGTPYLLRIGFGIRKPKNPVRGREVAGTRRCHGCAARSRPPVQPSSSAARTAAS